MSLTSPLVDKVALITGASGGIGNTIARALGAVGMRLVLTGHTSANLERSVQQLEAVGLDPDRMVDVRADLTEPEAGAAVVRAGLDAFGRIDVLVQAMGIGLFERFGDVPLDRIRLGIETNLLAAIYTAHHALPHLIEAQGHIVQIASGLSRSSNANAAVYAAAQHGIRGFVESLRLDLARHRVRVSLVTAAGAGVDTDFWDEADADVSRAGMLEPERVAEVVLVVLTTRGAALIDDVNVRTG